MPEPGPDPVLAPASRAGFAPTATHRKRLRALWRSAGWPSQDSVEIELIAAGWVERLRDGQGRETLRVTDAGIALLAAATARHRQALGEHERLVERIALQMQREGRLAWRGLSLRAPIAREERTDWVIAMPDVYSIRPSTRADATEPIAHEIKVRRADLLADLKKPDKARAYFNLASQCWYVLKAGIARADEIPPDYGVLLAHGERFELARPAPRRAMTLPHPVWLALARHNAEPMDDEAQRMLGEPPC